MNIRTEFCWSAPDDSRWSAVDDSTYDGPPCPVGTGRTKDLATIDLLEQLDDYEAADEMRAELGLAEGAQS